MNPYLAQFQELEIIGRGNFGSATLVREISTQQLFIAKKIILAGLKEKEQESAKQEAELLKSLNHPNIVAYRDSFMIDGTLIIIMEYCEEGDIAFHIKRKKNKGEYFGEPVILNWFIQIALALIYIHERKILHRDIKTSNIFLTSNGTVKIGDFGISRVLEHTQDNAQTVVGTPYYMSPEVCESKPYSQKSDVWALGCVTYELCTLKHAFNSNNLLGLVYKIVKEQVEDIPDFYSQDLKNLVKTMFLKNDVQRPTIRLLLNNPYLIKTVTDFVANQGQNIYQSDIPIRKTNTHMQLQHQNQHQQDDDGLGATVQSMQQTGNNQNNQTAFTIGQTINSMQQTQQKYDQTLGDTVQSMNYQPGLSQKEIIRLRKQQESDRKAMELTQAIRENASQVNIAKQRKQEQLGHSGMNMAKTMPSNNIQNLQRQEQQYLNQQHQMQYASQTQQFYPQGGQRNQNMNALTQQMNMLGISQNPNQYYNQPFDNSYQQTQQMYNMPVNANQQQQMNYGQYNNYMNNNSNNNNNYGNEQPIKTDDYNRNKFNNTNNGLDEYQDDYEEYFSDEEDDKNNTFSLTTTSNRLTLRATDSQREDVVNVYKDFINKKNNNNLEEIFESSQEQMPQTPQKVGKGGANQPANQMKDNKVQMMKNNCIQLLGEEDFNKVYKYINSKEGFREIKYSELYEMIGNDKKNYIQKVEELVYLEKFQ